VSSVASDLAPWSSIPSSRPDAAPHGGRGRHEGHSCHTSAFAAAIATQVAKEHETQFVVIAIEWQPQLFSYHMPSAETEARIWKMKPFFGSLMAFATQRSSPSTAPPASFPFPANWQWISTSRLRRKQ